MPAIQQVVSGDMSGLSSLVLSTDTTPVAGQTLVAVHGNDFYTASIILTPTDTHSSTFDPLVVADGGSNEMHIKAWATPVTVAGVQSVTFSESRSDEEKTVALYVITDGAFQAAAGASGSGTSSAAPSVSGTADGIVLCHWQAGQNGPAPTITPPVSMTQQYNVTDGNFTRGLGASEALTVTGTTGSRTATFGDAPWAAIMISFKPAGGTPISASGTATTHSSAAVTAHVEHHVTATAHQGTIAQATGSSETHALAIAAQHTGATVTALVERHAAAAAATRSGTAAVASTEVHTTVTATQGTTATTTAHTEHHVQAAAMTHSAGAVSTAGEVHATAAATQNTTSTADVTVERHSSITAAAHTLALAEAIIERHAAVIAAQTTTAAVTVGGEQHADCHATTRTSATVTAHTEHHQPGTLGEGLRVDVLADAILNAVIAHFDAAGQELPARRYVAPGDPTQISWDCEQVVVSLSGIGWGQAIDASETAVQARNLGPMGMRHAIYSVQIVRCTPSGSGRNAIPSVEDIQAAGMQFMRDAGLLSQALLSACLHLRQGLPRAADVQAGAIAPLGPAGGYHGMEGTIALTAGELG